MKHKLSDVESENIGTGTKVWQFVVILKEAKLGKNCNICANVFIENDVVIGNGVTIKPGVQIWDGTTIEDNVFIGPNVTFTNDVYPKSNNKEFELKRTLISKNVSIGANSTILPGIVIGENTLIGAGSLVTKDIPKNSVYFGVPAKFIRENK